MAPRLTVIVSQSAARNGRTVDIEESLVAQLMMTPGLDATLIGPLESIRPDSTDFLCLTGFQHSFAFLSWLDEATVVEHWNRLGLSGYVTRPGIAGGHPQKRRVYFLPLSSSHGTAAILQQLELLQRERSVQTVDILLAPPSPKPQRVERPTTEKPATPTSQQSIASELNAQPPNLKQISPTSPQDEAEEVQEWEELDRLINDLDAFEF